MGIGLTEGLLIAAIIILLFGSKKLPELGKGMGEAIKNFKKGMNEGASDDKKDSAKTEDDKKNSAKTEDDKKNS